MNYSKKFYEFFDTTLDFFCLVFSEIVFENFCVFLVYYALYSGHPLMFTHSRGETVEGVC